MTNQVCQPPSGSEFTAEDMAHTRSFFEEWKREHIGDSGVALVKHPTFRLALARLMNEHGYSLTDIGLFLGVSRERVRQWAVKSGIPLRRGAQYRIWDDDAMRFVTVDSKSEYDALVRRRTSPHGGKNVGKMRKRIARWILIDLGEDLGRVPGGVDLSDALRMSGSELNRWLWLNTGRDGIPSTIRSELDTLWKKSGSSTRTRAMGRRDAGATPHVVGSSSRLGVCTG